jgi:hypothetical protein
MFNFNLENNIHVETKSFFDRFISTNQYVEPEHDILLEMLFQNPNFMYAHAKYSTSRVWFDNYLKADKLLRERLNRSQPKPLAGDAVYIECENGRVYQDAMIAYEPCSLNEKFSIVTQGGGHIYNLSQSPFDSLKMSVCGGYFQSVHADEFLEIKDTVHKTFWFWGDTACAHGGLWITRPVPRWSLKQINPNFY